MVKHVLKEIMYQRSFVRKSEKERENLARFRIRDPVGEIYAQSFSCHMIFVNSICMVSVSRQ